MSERLFHPADVGLIIPWQDQPDRRRGLDYVTEWWASLGLEPGIGVIRPGEPWRKGPAIERGIAAWTIDLTEPKAWIVADADVVMSGAEGLLDLTRAVERVSTGREPWAVPHLKVHRHPAAGTHAIISGVAAHELPDPGVEIHQGHPGGGLVVLSPQIVADRVLPDPRYGGWGQEDDSWAFAIKTLYGPPWRGRAPLHHLWHKPQERQSRSVGSAEGEALYRRYLGALEHRRPMRALVDEGWAWWDDRVTRGAERSA